MKNYQVVALSVAGIGRVLSARDIVDENAFEAAHIPELIKAGFIKEYDGDLDARKISEVDLQEHPEFTERGLQVGDFYPAAPQAANMQPANQPMLTPAQAPAELNAQADADKAPEAKQDTTADLKDMISGKGNSDKRVK